jgi:hypothetical protein
VDFQSGPFITALTRLVTYDWPKLTGPGGCSLTAPDGAIHDTAGKLPALAALSRLACRWPRTPGSSGHDLAARFAGYVDRYDVAGESNSFTNS